ncbi:MAG: phosphoglycerate kinase [Parcubacteria bacterium C7867-005]|nr:MAG: phosphoglycerate kinase [Parcubacteria bacterium C7867-005]
MDFKTILEAGDLRGKRVLVRVDWNVPIEDGVVTDDFRITQSLPTIEYLIRAGAKIVLISHLGNKGASLKPVFECAKTMIPNLTFGGDGDITLLENLRDNEGEEKNTRDFALELSKYGDLFVNEAFSVSHREHASIVGVPKLLPSFAGLLFGKEVKSLSRAFYPKHPFLFILGGAKFDTKLPLIDKFMGVADSLFVGGALAHNFFRELGKNLGKSLVSPGDFDLESKYQSGKIMLPDDVVVENEAGSSVEDVDSMKDNDMIMDAGPKSINQLKSKIAEAQFILWNGPLGNYELGYKEATHSLAKILSQSNKEVIVGGADTIACIKELGLYEKFSFVSTGGGAMLDFLANGSLPGIESLKRP